MVLGKAVGTEARTKQGINQCFDRYRQKIRTNQGIEQHEIKQDIDLGGKLGARAGLDVALLQWHCTQKNPVHDERPAVNQRDQQDDIDHRVEIPQPLPARQQVSANNGKQDNQSQQQQEKTYLACGNFAHKRPLDSYLPSSKFIHISLINLLNSSE
ncbi:MAG: hypothetical protein R3E50_04895 [Halioglobus sp.]